MRLMIKHFTIVVLFLMGVAFFSTAAPATAQDDTLTITFNIPSHRRDDPGHPVRLAGQTNVAPELVGRTCRVFVESANREQPSEHRNHNIEAVSTNSAVVSNVEREAGATYEANSTLTLGNQLDVYLHFSPTDPVSSFGGRVVINCNDAPSEDGHDCDGSGEKCEMDPRFSCVTYLSAPIARLYTSAGEQIPQGDRWWQTYDSITSEIYIEYPDGHLSQEMMTADLENGEVVQIQNWAGFAAIYTEPVEWRQNGCWRVDAVEGNDPYYSNFAVLPEDC